MFLASLVSANSPRYDSYNTASCVNCLVSVLSRNSGHFQFTDKNTEQSRSEVFSSYCPTDEKCVHGNPTRVSRNPLIFDTPKYSYFTVLVVPNITTPYVYLDSKCTKMSYSFSDPDTTYIIARRDSSYTFNLDITMNNDKPVIVQVGSIKMTFTETSKHPNIDVKANPVVIEPNGNTVAIQLNTLYSPSAWDVTDEGFFTFDESAEIGPLIDGLNQDFTYYQLMDFKLVTCILFCCVLLELMYLAFKQMLDSPAPSAADDNQPPPVHVDKSLIEMEEKYEEKQFPPNLPSPYESVNPIQTIPPNPYQSDLPGQAVPLYPMPMPPPVQPYQNQPVVYSSPYMPN